MATLHVRDVLDEVTQTLKERATAEGKSLSAYVAAELARIAARSTNAESVARLRDTNHAEGRAPLTSSRPRASLGGDRPRRLGHGRGTGGA
jgi:hypothetical protein